MTGPCRHHRLFTHLAWQPFASTLLYELADIAHLKIDADPVGFNAHCSTGSIQAFTDLVNRQPRISQFNELS
jgi:hypothetical protein